VHWPARIRDGGALRHQFHHVVDLTPTVLDLLGIEAPTVYRGVAQLPFHGTSLAYTFDAPDAPTRKQTQYFELLGDRGLWHDGWKVVARHEQGTDFEQDHWELYHLDRDFSECRDLAKEQPEKLREMVERWWSEAGRYGVLPLDDREYERVAASVAARARRQYVYYPGMARIDRFSAPDITDRSYAITAELELPAGGAEGVLLESGARFGGYVLYVKDGRPVHEYAFSERERFTIVSDIPLPAGRSTVRYVFKKSGVRQGTGTLSVDGRVVGTAVLPKTWPTVGVTAGIRCGRGGPVPISDGYPAPFPFSGTIHRVVVELENDGVHDLVAAYQGALAEE
jgi:arylsulfatase